MISTPSSYLIVCSKLKHRIPSAIATWNSLGLSPTLLYSFDADQLLPSLTNNQSLWLERLPTILPDLLTNANLEPSILPQLPDSSVNHIMNDSRFAWLQHRSLKPGEISVSLKHFSALSSIADGDEDYAFVSEDDTRYIPFSFESFWSDVSDFITADGDYLDLAGGCHLDPYKYSVSSFNNIAQIDKPRTRTNACYLISRRFAQSIVNMFLPIVFPIDWHLQWCFNSLPNDLFTCYWTVIPPIIHGSETGLVTSWRTS